MNRPPETYRPRYRYYIAAVTGSRLSVCGLNTVIARKRCHDVLAALHTALFHLVDPGHRVTMASLTLTRVNQQSGRFRCEMFFSSISRLLVVTSRLGPPCMWVAFSVCQIRVEALTPSRYANLGAPRENEPNARRVTVKDRPGHGPRYELHGAENPLTP
jgi:hypothetical protein